MHNYSVIPDEDLYEVTASSTRIEIENIDYAIFYMVCKREITLTGISPVPKDKRLVSLIHREFRKEVEIERN